MADNPIAPWTPPPDMTVGRVADTHTSFKFEAELLGGHVHIKVRAATRTPSAQVNHSRGLCGKLVMSPGEWLLLRATLRCAPIPKPLWLTDGGRGRLLAPAGPPVSYHDDQQFIELTGWPD